MADKLNLSGILGFELLEEGNYIALNVLDAEGNPQSITFPYDHCSEIITVLISACERARKKFDKQPKHPDGQEFKPFVANTIQVAKAGDGSFVFLSIASKDFISNWALNPKAAHELNGHLFGLLAMGDGDGTRH